MDKSNIIISIIIVLCIAAAVTAYGITNSDNPIFSNLSSMGANNAGHGIGNNTTLGNHSASVATTAGSSNSGAGSGSSDSDSSSSGSSSSSDSGSSSSSSSSSDSGSSSSSSSSSSDSPSMSYSDAEAIAASSVLEEGCYVGEGYYSDGMWIFNVYDSNGTIVDSIGVDASGMTNEA